MTSIESRRDMLKYAAAVSAAAIPLTKCTEVRADEDAPHQNERKVVIGVMGMQRGLALAKAFARQDNVEVRYVCDVDATRLEAAANTMQMDLEHSSQPVPDFRTILDDPEVDALACAAPNHWHGPATILACQAGKHVYVEKPASHNPAEGELMVRAARKYRRLVQVGTQRRSNPAWIDAIQRIQAGAIGDAFLARSWYANLRGSIGEDRFVETPEFLDYDLWQGPAPRKPYSGAVVHYNWHWRWHWGNGEVGNNGVHTIDLCRWGLDVGLPEETSSVGGRYAFEDVQETPDTNTVSFRFPNKKSITWDCTSCNRHTHGFVTFYGSDGTLEIDDDGTNRQFDRSDQLVIEHPGSPHSLRDHIVNFLECIRNESLPSALNADIQIGHESALLCHLANMSYRVGRRLTSDPATGKVKADPNAMKLWRRAYEPTWEPKV